MVIDQRSKGASPREKAFLRYFGLKMDAISSSFQGSIIYINNTNYSFLVLDPKEAEREFEFKLVQNLSKIPSQIIAESSLLSDADITKNKFNHEGVDYILSLTSFKHLKELVLNRLGRGFIVSEDSLEIKSGEYFIYRV